MGYVLFSPVGNTDPIRGCHDGAWLHICRVYQPKVTRIYLSAEMCRRENVVEEDGQRKNLYARTLRLLNQHLFGDRAERYIQLEFVRDPQCENAHSLEYFVPLYQKLLTQLHADYPEDELLVNVSSGTPGMKGTLMALSTILPFKVQLIQVRDWKKDQNEKEETVRKNYPVDIAFELNEDNRPDFERRDSLQPLTNLALAMRVDDLCHLVREGDYHTALAEANGDSLKSFLPAKALFALQGADQRISMKVEPCVISLEKSGFHLKRRYGLRSDDRLWQCAEYLLTMRNDLKNGAFDNFMRKLTPLLVNLFELYLASVGKDVRKNGVNGDGKWVNTNIPPEWLKILDTAFYGRFNDYSDLSSANMLPLISAFGSTQARLLAESLRKVEQKARNPFAHEMIPFSRQDVEGFLRSAKVSGISTPEALTDRLQDFLETIKPFQQDYWNSYDAMNEHICGLLKQ